MYLTQDCVVWIQAGKWPKQEENAIQTCAAMLSKEKHRRDSIELAQCWLGQLRWFAAAVVVVTSRAIVVISA